MKQGNSYTHIFKYTSLFAGVQGLNILIGLVRTKFVAVLLGPAGVGLLSVYNTASTLLQNATNFGIHLTGVREISVAYQSGDETELHRCIRILRSWSIAVALLGFAASIAFSRLLSQWAFSDGEYTFRFMLLAPVVAFATIAGGETAVLKATRRLSQLAKVSIGGVIASLVVSVPLYMKWGDDGIIPSLILVAGIQMVIVAAYSYRYYPLRLKFGGELREGKSMLVVGAAFVVAGVLGSGAEFMIRAFLSDMSLSLVGLYNTGYTITMTYAGMVFAAMETDYFPFLSSVCRDTTKMNGAVNRQIEVSMVMLAPFLALLMAGLPILIPLLFSGKFIPVIGMTQTAVLAMYFRAVYLPIAYIMLAKGDSRSFLFAESVSAVVMVVAIIVSYTGWGLEGTGAGLALASLFDCIFAACYCSWRYDFVLSSDLLLFVVEQIAIALITLAIVKYAGWWYWPGCVVMIAASALLSLRKFKGRIKPAER